METVFNLPEGPEDQVPSLALESPPSLPSDPAYGFKDALCNLCHDPQGWGPLTSNDRVSPCFLDGIILAAAVLLAILSIYQTVVLRHRRPLGTRPTWDFGLKLVLVGAQALLFIASAVLYAVSHTYFVSDIRFWALTVSALSLIPASLLHYTEHFRSIIPNGVLLFYWLGSTIILSARAAVAQSAGGFHNGGVEKSSVIVSIFLATNALIVFVLEWLIPKSSHLETRRYAPLSSGDASDVSNDEDLYDDAKVKNPRDYADVFSRLTFSWMSPLMKRGYDTYLTDSDLPELPKGLNSNDSAAGFSKKWQDQLRSGRAPSLTKTLLRSYGAPFIQGALFKAIQDILAFVQPQLLRMLIAFVAAYPVRDPGSASLVPGALIACSMFLVSVVQTAALHQYFQQAFDTGMNLKAGLTAVIYRKSLVLSNEDRGKKTSGDIVNLMAVDTQRLQDLCQYGQILWSGPFQIILCLVSLHNLLGPAMWAGVVVMVVMIPLNAVIARTQRSLQKTQMTYKDSRSRLISEILTNIKSLKLYGWEDPFRERLEYVRNDQELKNLRRIGLFSALSNFTWNCAPFLVSCCTFAVFVLTQDRPLTTEIVFPALALFNLLSFPLAVIPMVIAALVEASVAINRLESFLTAGELQPDAVVRLAKTSRMGEEAVSIRDATFVWSRDEEEYRTALTHVNYTARKGELSCVIGKVGAGKSAFMQALLGDLHRVDGSVVVHGSVAYVAQVPWIMNGTVRDNILFGSKYDAVFYRRTLEACALVEDLEMLADGDMTEVGEKGISLSGGQKARLSLARAVYARADVYLLDDPLSAVDEHVGRHLIDQVLGPHGLLRHKTRVLSTNSISVLAQADRVTMLADGRIVEEGTYSAVVAAGGPIAALVKEFGKKRPKHAAAEPSGNGSEAQQTRNPAKTAETTPEVLSDSGSVEYEEEPVDLLVETESIPDTESLQKIVTGQSLRRASTASFSPAKMRADAAAAADARKEHSEQGKVKWHVYREYARSCNPYAVAVFLCFILLSVAVSVLSNVWLKHWSEVNSREGGNPHIGFYLGVYFALGVGASFMTLVQTAVLWIYCSIAGSRVLHHGMVVSVLRAPMIFFETTPLGRILNRFSNDIYKVDEVLARTFSQFFSNTAKVLFTIVVVCVSTWQVLFVIIPLAALYLHYQKYYLRTSRELKRLDSVTRSPIFAHFQETLTGVTTIRAYRQQQRFNRLNEHKVDENLKAYHPSINANRWLAVRLEFIGSVIIFAAAGMAVASLVWRPVSAGIVGLSLSYALSITQSLNWIVRMTVEVETNIVSVERILEYSGLPSEAPEHIPDRPVPPEWPQNGAVEFKHYSARYRPELDLALRDICISVKPREKIGIVGRTGAGKSSLTLALFRIIEAASGHIAIDDINTSLIGLADLRHRLSIIPQDSQVFEGSIRDNLDPFKKYSDEKLWWALKLAHLEPHVAAMDGGLDAKVSEGGSNLSVGQRQLMCLARALLAESRVLVLDEATAAVDVETDKVLQETIRKEFKDRTILTIAHRLNTIMDSDKILALSKGEVAEFDSPANLLKNKDGLFYSLCKEAGFVHDDDQPHDSRITEVDGEGEGE